MKHLLIFFSVSSLLAILTFGSGCNSSGNVVVPVTPDAVTSCQWGGECLLIYWINIQLGNRNIKSVRNISGEGLLSSGPLVPPEIRAMDVTSSGLIYDITPTTITRHDDIDDATGITRDLPPTMAASGGIDLVIDEQGLVYVTGNNLVNGLIAIYDRDLNLINLFDATGITSLGAITIGGDGAFYFTSNNALGLPQVSRVEGIPWGGSTGIAAPVPGFQFPAGATVHGIAVDANNHVFLYTDLIDFRVIRLETFDSVAFSFILNDVAGVPFTNGKIDVDDIGRLYITDITNNRIVRVSGNLADPVVLSGDINGDGILDVDGPRPIAIRLPE
jgi:sugar lactone lactonase YvrE